MIQYFKKENGKLQQLEALQPSCWINIAPPFTQEELEHLTQELDIPLDFLTDSLDIDERSRYEREDGVKLIVINAPIINSAESTNSSMFITVPIGIILTGDIIITISSFENPVLQRFLDDKIKNFDPGNTNEFVLQIFEQSVYRFLICLKDLNIKRNLIEQELYNSGNNKELKELLGIEKSLIYFLTSLSANELLMMKIKRTDFLGIRGDEELVDLLDDVIIDNSQANEMANTYSTILSGTMNAFASIISNNLNEVMQRLTLITIILMLPTLVASFYGMNVDLPFKESNAAFYGILIFSVFVSLLLAWFFRRKRWF
ncbi:MAG: magnesium transporter CorA family protein [Bacteroidota bacterium]